MLAISCQLPTLTKRISDCKGREKRVRFGRTGRRRKPPDPVEDVKEDFRTGPEVNDQNLSAQLSLILILVYFHMRILPSAIHSTAVAMRLFRVSSVFASVTQSTYSFLLV